MPVTRRRKADVYGKIVGAAAKSGADQGSDATLPPLGEETEQQPGNEVITQSSNEALPIASSEAKTQESTTTLPDNTTTGQQESGNTAIVQSSNEVKKKKTPKITFYPTPEQDFKLNDLVAQHWLRHHRMIGVNDILRHLVERCTIESLDDLEQE
jgi:hypothetical protein